MLVGSYDVKSVYCFILTNVISINGDMFTFIKKNAAGCKLAVK